MHDRPVVADESTRGAHGIGSDERRLGDRAREAHISVEFFDERLEATEVFERVRQGMPAAKGGGGQGPGDPRILVRDPPDRLGERLPIPASHHAGLRSVEGGCCERSAISHINASHFVEEALDIVSG